MPISQITLKHNKHRVHPCPNDKKLSLLTLLIEQNSNLDAIVITTQDSSPIKNKLKNENIKVLSDNELLELPELKCKLLISYDLPSSADVYIQRISRATESALILLDISEQKQLYPIETLLKRVIKQEIIAGFEYEEQASLKIAKAALKPKREYALKQDTNSKPKHEKKSFNKPKKDSKKPNKFLGKDENGKAIFSGKSGERNHRYDGKPKDGQVASKSTGRKISIKERKPKNADETNS